MKRINRFIIAMLILSLAVRQTAVSHAAEYTSLSLTDEDIDLIARAVCAEAGEEDHIIKACVASMIMNRLQDPAFPDSVDETVYERGAFLFAKRENIDCDLPEADLFDCRILTKIIYTYGIDPTCGALFCFTDGDPDADDMNVTVKFDGFVFAKP